MRRLSAALIVVLTTVARWSRHLRRGPVLGARQLEWDIRALPPYERAVVILVHRMPIPEVARRLGRTEAEVTAVFWRTMQHLVRRHLERTDRRECQPLARLMRRLAG